MSAMFEDQVRHSRWRDTRVDESSDMRVRQLREHIALAAEPFLDRAADQRSVQQFDSRAPFEAPVAAFGEPHAAHSALADERQEAVRANDLSLH